MLIRKLLVVLSPLGFAVAALAQNPPSLAATTSFWKDPEFVKSFMGSYGFQSETQPKVTPEEAKLLGAVAGQLSSNTPRAAIDTLKAAITPTSSEVLSFALGTVYLQEQNYAEAELHLKKAIATFPTYLRAHQNLGIVYVQQSKFEQLIGELTKTVELGGEKGAVYGLLGYAYMSLGRYLPAEVAYSKALLFEPDKLEWKAGYAECLRLQNKDRESIAAFGELIRQEPEETKYWIGQAYSFTSLGSPGDIRKAAQNYEIVRRMGKADTQVLNWLGTFYINERMFDQGRAAFVEAFKTDPNKDADGLLRSAEALLVYGSPAEAEVLLNSVRSEAAARMNEEQQLRTLRLTAQIQLNSGKDAEAIKTLEQVLQKDPTDGKSMLLLGSYHARLATALAGQEKDDPAAREKANEHVAKAAMHFELASNRPESDVKRNALISWAQLLVNRGDYARALPLLRQAQQVEFKENVAGYLAQLEKFIKNAP